VLAELIVEEVPVVEPVGLIEPVKLLPVDNKVEVEVGSNAEKYGTQLAQIGKERICVVKLKLMSKTRTSPVVL